MFQDLFNTITTFIMVAVVAVTGVLHRPTFTPVQPIDTPIIATSSATISESPSPSASPTLAPSVTSKPKQPIFVQKEIEPIPTIIPSTIQKNPIQYPPTYRTLTLTELVNLNGANSTAITAAQNAYNIFVRTSNLIYMSPAEQSNLYKPILEAEINRLLDEEKKRLQSQSDWYDQQTSILQQQEQQNQANNAAQECLDNKLASINNNPYLSASSKQAQVNKAYQDCGY